MALIIIKFIVAKLRYFGIKCACKYLSGLYLTLYPPPVPEIFQRNDKVGTQSVQPRHFIDEYGFFGKRVCLAYNDLFCKAKFYP